MIDFMSAAKCDTLSAVNLIAEDHHMYLKDMPLTFEQVDEMIAYDPLTGSFTWKKAPNRSTKVGDEAGTFKSVRTKSGEKIAYKYLHVSGHSTPAARIAWLLTHREWPATNIQFKDNNPSNLRVDNLQLAKFPSIKKVLGERRSYKMTPEAARHACLKSNYGIGIEDYNQMLADQGGVCAICKLPETSKTPYGGPIKPLSVDHNHNTGTVRGLLCTQCNYMIGHCRENREFLLEGVKYLDKHAGRKMVPTLTLVATEDPK